MYSVFLFIQPNLFPTTTTTLAQPVNWRFQKLIYQPHESLWWMCFNYKRWIYKPIFLPLQTMHLTWSTRAVEMKGISFWLGANESLNPEGLWGSLCKQTHTQTHAVRPHVCRADPDCSASLLGSHEQHVLTEGRSSRRRDLLRGWMPRKSAAGGTDERRRGSKRQDSGGACPDLFGWGLRCPWGEFTAWLGVFSVSKTGVVWKHDGNHRDKAKGFHHTPCWRAKY